MCQLKSDLVIVFGFTKQNAEKAMQLWRQGKLDPETSRAMNNLLVRPFDHTNIDSMKVRNSAHLEPILTPLNYKISNGEI